MNGSQAWWYTLVIPALRRLRQEDREFEALLCYMKRFLSSPDSGWINEMCSFQIMEYYSVIKRNEVARRCGAYL
jgi:hypothetical protein